MIRSVVHGCGAYLPERVLTNAELATTVDTSDEWIQQRTGIRQRHIAADGELTSHLANKASQRALDNAAERSKSGGIPPTSTVPAAEAFDWITTRGAAMLGLGDRIGSLAPGKPADIAVMSLGPLAMWPVHDPVASVVMQGSGARMRDVLVAGRFAKRDGKLAWPDLKSLRARLAASGERILSRLHVKSVSREIAAT